MTAEPSAVAVVAALRAAGQTLATAESLTGGMIGAWLTAVPGASEVYLGGMVTYATAMKTRLLGVPQDLVATCGVVSERVVSQMAARVRQLTGADWAVAVSGVAGPAGQEGHRPGEVWIGLAGPDGLGSGVRSDFAGDRAWVREQTAAAALGRVLEAVLRRAQAS
jgi:PncC family amidohydrolase